MSERDATTSEHTKAVLAGSGRHKKPEIYHPTSGLQGTILTYTVAGHAFFRTAGREFISGRYDLILIRGGTTAIEFGPQGPSFNWRNFWAEFDTRPAWLEWLNWPEELPGVLRLRLTHPGHRRVIARRFARVCRIARGHRPFRAEFAINALENLLLCCRLANLRESRVPIDSRVRLASDFMIEHLVEDLTLAQIAAAVHLSPSHLEGIFKEQTGMTLFSFRDLQRMRRAAVMLERTAKPVRQIAAEVGYTDPLYFSKRFRNCLRVSPREYRQLHKLGMDKRPRTH